MRRRLQALLLALVACGTSGCAWVRGPGHVTFASDPPGATVVVNGTPSGFATPCRFSLPRKTRDVDLVLPGYQTTRVRLSPDGQWYSLEWPEMILYPNTWRFPLWIPIQDALKGVHRRSILSPNRIFVRLRRTADR